MDLNYTYLMKNKLFRKYFREFKNQSIQKYLSDQMFYAKFYPELSFIWDNINL